MSVLSNAEQADEIIKEMILAKYDISTGKHKFAHERMTVIQRMLQALHNVVWLEFHRSGEGPR